MRMQTRVLLLGTMIATLGAASVARAQASDPVIGTWVLNVAKSTYSLGTAPKSSTRSYTAVENGYTFTSKGVDATGKAVSTTFTVHFDGKYAPMTGGADSDAIMVKRIDANTTESTQKRGDKVVIHTRRVVSKDGKTLTGTSSGTNAAGKEYKNVEVFDKK
ncbi:MAG: hypothetical protein NTZ43_02260 [Gemmatimonadetes bacterium]|nr:hypothetical protein [Gemmatimonadota bacterium]